MEKEIAPRGGAYIGGTVVALLIAPIVLAVCAAVVGAIWFLFNNVFTVIRPEILGFGAALVGGYAGTYSARAACDAVLKSYSLRAIFVELAIFGVLILFVELTLPFSWARVTPLAQLAVIVWMSWVLFWTGEEI